ncbi:hypothetical protein [Brevibacillus porteri]|uniref:hypothetical protein n=1 Tax=Brevibacillus porteri TaxID=2126350 RepID=UPI00364524D1
MKKYTYIQLKQDEYKPYQINIIAEVEENGWFYTDIIGRFSFYDMSGNILLVNGKRKQYKRFTAMLNFVYTLDQNAMMDTNLIDTVKEEAKHLKEEQQTEATNEQLKKEEIAISAFTTEELNNPTIKRLIAEHADRLTTQIISERENIDLSNKPVSQWNKQERYNWKYYYPTNELNIIDGTYSNVVDSIRAEFKEYKNKKEHRIMVEKSFELPDHEVPLSIFIERSCKAESVLRTEHENIVKSAIEQRMNVPADVLVDYPHLVNNNTVENQTSDFDPSIILQEKLATVLPIDLQYFSSSAVEEQRSILYFNTYSPEQLTNTQWQQDISKHIHKYNELSSKEVLSVNELQSLIDNNYRFWVKVINKEPYFHKDSYLIDLYLSYINKAMSVYISKDAFESLKYNN